MVGMKLKMHQQIQPSETSAPHSPQVRLQVHGEAKEEIQNFLRAVDSYPARVAREPRVTFQQHLCSIFAARSNRDDSHRDNRLPLH
jgi:hypothetical protein